VRATAIVLKAYQAGTLPPAVVEIASLSGNSMLPELAELKEVMNMQQLVQCIEYIYFNSNFPKIDSEKNVFFDVEFGKYPAARRRFPDYLKENIPGTENTTIDSFRDGFFRAMYRLLLAGAVLARAYMAPVFQAREERNARFFLIFTDSNYYWSQDIEDLEVEDKDTRPREADLAYLRQYPVYNFDVSDKSKVGQWRNREYEGCFGPFASWIIQDGRIRERNEPQDPNDAKPEWAENRADVGAVRELMLLLVAYDHFNHCFQNLFWDSSPYLQKQGNRTVSIVRFGIFKVEQITMPAAVEDLTDTPLVAKYHPALDGTAGEDIKYQIDNFVAMWELSQDKRTDIPYHREHPGPPAMLELWRFALRHYLNLTFKPWTFWMPEEDDCIWWTEVGRGEVFLNPNWNVVQKYDPGVISWDYRNY
jgi:hypothetical protein